MSQSVGPTDITRDGSLWRDRNFLTMWTGQAFAQFGAQITELALPVVAVLALHATEMQVGVLNAAGVAAFLVVGLPAGAWIDRMRKRRVMMVADLVRALALACIPALWLADALQIWHLAVVALVTGIATVFFDVSYQASSRRWSGRPRSRRPTANSSRPRSWRGSPDRRSAAGWSECWRHRWPS